MATKRAESVKKEIRRVLEIEAAAILKARDAVDGSYARAVSLLEKCRGKTILMGVGKSGLIAQKIAATFSSTGAPAMFLDPTEAKHGGLGFIQKQDLIVVIGKSGESEEMSALFPAIKSIGVLVIAVTANPSSMLAKNATVVVKTPIQEEACPLNLAPTASTTAALAVGDALAIALMKIRNFGPEHFAKNHPGGRLGKRLALSAKDVMRSGDANPIVIEDWPVSRSIVEITRFQTGAASVVNAKGRFVGLMTDYDIRRALVSKKNIMSLATRTVMNQHPISISPTESVFRAIEIMENRKTPFNVLPVVEKGYPVGLIQIHDLRARGL